MQQRQDEKFLQDVATPTYGPWQPQLRTNIPVQQQPYLGANGTWNNVSADTSDLNHTVNHAPRQQNPVPASTPFPAPTQNNETQFAWQLLQSTQMEMAALRQQLNQLQLNATTMYHNETINAPEAVIPLFDPDSPSGFRAADWLRRVEEIGAAYEWSNARCLSRALNRLSGAAQSWYETAAAMLTTWNEFKIALVHAFPNCDDAATIHAMLAGKKRKPSETHATYAYEMLAIGRRGGVSEHDVVSYILRGLDAVTATALAALPLNTVEEFLIAVSRYETRRVTLRTDPKQAKSSEPNQTTPPIKNCFNCGQKGHLSRDCRRREQGPKCFECQEFGHRAKDCPRKRSNRVMCIMFQNAFSKKVFINGAARSAVLDTGSACNIITEKVIEELSAVREPCHRILSGFGGAEVKCTESALVQVTIDDLVFEVPFLIISDNCLQADLVLGAPFLASITYKAEYGNIVLINSPSKTIEQQNPSKPKEEPNKKRKDLQTDDQEFHNELLEIMLTATDDEEIEIGPQVKPNYIKAIRLVIVVGKQKHSYRVRCTVFKE